jgi:hypothetical protein
VEDYMLTSAALRTALRIDAVASGGLGAILLTFCRSLDEPLGLPVLVSASVGVGLLAWAGAVGWISIDAHEPLAREVVVANVVWVLASGAFAVSGWVDLTGLGVTFVLGQALAVAVVTGMQVRGLRQARTAVPV